MATAANAGPAAPIPARRDSTSEALRATHHQQPQLRKSCCGHTVKGSPLPKGIGILHRTSEMNTTTHSPHTIFSRGTQESITCHQWVRAVSVLSPLAQPVLDGAAMERGEKTVKENISTSGNLNNRLVVAATLQLSTAQKRCSQKYSNFLLRWFARATPPVKLSALSLALAV